MTKEELKKELENSLTLDLAIGPFEIGQCGCTIYKGVGFDDDPSKFPDHICYIPDMELNEISYQTPWLPKEEIENILECCYTFQDFIDLCHGDINKAKIVYNNCDWQHPSSEYEEMNQIGWGDDYEQPPHAVTQWYADDIIGIAKSAGLEMTDEQAEDWWREHEREFRQMLVQAGNEMLETMIK